MTAKTQLWHRQDVENEEQWVLFDMFLRERNVSEVARQYFGDRGEQGLLAGRVYIQRLKKEKNWDMRVKAYDRWVAKQKDDATGARIQQEISEIRNQRVTVLRKVSRKVMKAIESVQEQDFTDKDLFKVSILLEITTKMDGLWRKFEESNPASATVEKPFENEIAGAHERLLALVDSKQKKLEDAPKHKEILQ